MTAKEVVFLLLSIVCAGSAALVVTTRQLVHAALWLAVTLGSIAGCFLLLTAEFVAWVQLLIYVGAIVVLLLFGLMLTRAPIGPSNALDSANKPIAAAVGLATCGVLVTVLVVGFHSVYLDVDAIAKGSPRVTGESIFRSWVLPFELLSVLLLAALVGAIALSRSDAVKPRRAGEG
jgi:NADH-quinone oxidoreductase subunit J